HSRPRTGIRRVGDRAGASRRARRRALHQVHVPRDNRVAVAAHQARSAGVRVRDGAEDAHRAVQRDPPPGEPRLARLPARNRAHRGPCTHGARLPREARRDPRTRALSRRDRVPDRSAGGRSARPCAGCLGRRRSRGVRAHARPSAGARPRSAAGTRHRTARSSRRERPPRRVSWFARNWEEVAIAFYEHVQISLTALVIAAAISLALGIWAARSQRVYSATLAITGTLYTVPTLAFLALLIPLVGLGKVNVIIAMVAFSLVIMTRNVATGIREVAADIVEAAKGMG